MLGSSNRGAPAANRSCAPSRRARTSTHQSTASSCAPDPPLPRARAPVPVISKQRGDGWRRRQHVRIVCAEERRPKHVSRVARAALEAVSQGVGRKCDGVALGGRRSGAGRGRQRRDVLGAGCGGVSRSGGGGAACVAVRAAAARGHTPCGCVRLLASPRSRSARREPPPPQLGRQGPCQPLQPAPGIGDGPLGLTSAAAAWFATRRSGRAAATWRAVAGRLAAAPRATAGARSCMVVLTTAGAGA